MPAPPAPQKRSRRRGLVMAAASYAAEPGRPVGPKAGRAASRLGQAHRLGRTDRVVQAGLEGVLPGDLGSVDLGPDVGWVRAATGPVRVKVVEFFDVGGGDDGPERLVGRSRRGFRTPAFRGL